MSGNNWMSGIADQTSVADLAIPGTHDSGTYTFWAQLVPHALTQTLNSSIYDQLTAGVRGLDIRVKQVGNNLEVVHNDVFVGIELNKILQDLTRFLSENPTETVVASLKFDGIQVPLFSRETEAQLLSSALRDESVAGYLLGYGSGQLPENVDYSHIKIGDVRGKVIIIDRTGNKLGLDASFWPDNTTFVSSNNLYSVQDVYSSPPFADKIEAISSFVKISHPGLNFNFTSAATSLSNLLVGPKEYAGTINPFLAGQLDGTADGSIAAAAATNSLRGVFFTDFAQTAKSNYALYDNGSDWLALSELSSWLPGLIYGANRSVSLEVQQQTSSASQDNAIIPQPLLSVSANQIATIAPEQKHIVKLGSAFDITLSTIGYTAGQKLYFSLTPDASNSVIVSGAAVGSFVIGSQETITLKFDADHDPRGIDQFSVQLFANESHTSKIGAPFTFYVESPLEHKLAGSSATNQDFINDLYIDILRRAPDSTGQSYWLNQLSNGLDRKEAIISFYVSSECSAEIKDDKSFVKALYADLLDKAPQTAELAFWLDKLSGDQTREGVVRALVETPDFQKLFYLGTNHPDLSTNLVSLSAPLPADFVTGLYTEIFHRVPDIAGLDYWIGQLNAGAKRSQIATDFFCSAEFQSSNDNTSSFIYNLYEVVLNRVPDLAGERYWMQQLDNGMPRDTVVQSFLHSSELKILLGLSPATTIPLLDVA